MISIADADAVLVLRSLKLWHVVIALPGVDVVLTGYVAKHELNSILAELEAAQANGLLRIEHLQNKTPAWKTWRALKKEPKVDKGEAESIAWAVHNAPNSVLVSHDDGARRAAKKQKLRAMDVLELLVELVGKYDLDRDLVETALGLWEDGTHAYGRPRRFTTVRDALDGV